MMELIDAVVEQRIEQVACILDSGLGPNCAQDVCGISPLHFAAQANLLDIAFLLLEAGADAQAETICGQTPSQVAAMHGHQQMIQLLSSYWCAE